MLFLPKISSVMAPGVGGSPNGNFLWLGFLNSILRDKKWPKRALKMVEFHDCASTDTKYKKGMSKKFATKLATRRGWWVWVWVFLLSRITSSGLWEVTTISGGMEPPPTFQPSHSNPISKNKKVKFWNGTKCKTCFTHLWSYFRKKKRVIFFL